MFQSASDLKETIKGAITVRADANVAVTSPQRLETELIDQLIYNAVFNPDKELKGACQWLIRAAGISLGIVPASIQSFYEAMGRGEVSGFTVPAINIRGLTYDSARAVFRAANKLANGAVIFEIAKSEIQYTFQSPAEYAAVVMAAAIKEGFRGPLFVQGDHFQVNAKKFTEDPRKEVDAVKTLIDEAIAAGFYNIDIDASTLVDLSKESLREQQRNNFEITVELTAHIRSKEPQGVTVSVGGEIGEVGGKNSTVDELKAFIDNYNAALRDKKPGLKGISKISVQTGTTHGGVPLPDGTVAQVKLDFATLENLSRVSRSEYGLSGAVQHGASTLPNEAFDKFPATTTAEIHLATGFQNILYESSHFPADLREKMYAWLREHCASERKEKETEEQFLYKTRKKGFGPFKQPLWDLPADLRLAMGKELEQQFDFLFRTLNAVNTRTAIQQHIKPVAVIPPVPAVLTR
jgi:fructose/tagatose bisphosphate aldolase